MNTNTVFRRKENEHDITPCQIERIIMLSDMEFENFSKNLLRDYDFINDNIDDMIVDKNGVCHCLLVMGETEQDGYIIDSQGASYSRYSGYFPNARDFVNTQIRKMADKMVKDGTELTESGSWTMEFDDIKEHFDTTVTNTNGIGQQLLDELCEREEVAECIMTEDSIEMTYHLKYCPECQQGGIAGAMSLMSLVGCNVEDLLLCHHDQPEDIFVLGQFDENTLTVSGNNEWQDILSAKVDRVFLGDEGIQAELSGVSFDRLCDFIYLLSGHCNAEDYDKFINKSEPEQTMTME